jgi:hypothetical protein
MALRIARLELEVVVANRLITVYDDGGDQRVPDLHDLNEWFFTGDNAVLAISAGISDHPATVVMEAWNGEPDPVTGWEERAERRMRLDSGNLEVEPGEVPPHTQMLRVGPRGGYHVRAYAKGRDAIANPPPGTDLYRLRGVEFFLFQFWPSTDNPGWG